MDIVPHPIRIDGGSVEDCPLLNRLNTNIEGTITTRRRLFMSAKKAHSLRKEVYRKRLVQMQLCRRSLLIAVSLNQLRWLS